MIVERIRSVSVVALIAVAVAAFLMLAMMAGSASAEVVSAPAQSAPTVVRVVDPTGWSMEAVLIGVLVLLKAVSMVLDYIAPRTKSTWDDELKARIDAILSLAPNSKPQAVPSVYVADGPSEIKWTGPGDKPRDPQRGFIGRDMLITLAFAVVVAIGGGVVACATIRDRGTAGAQVFIDCQETTLKAAAADLIPLAKSAILRWLSGDGRAYDMAGIKDDAAALKSDAPRCAFDAAIAILSTPPEQPAGNTLLAVQDPGATLRERWPGLKSDLGWRMAP